MRRFINVYGIIVSNEKANVLFKYETRYVRHEKLEFFPTVIL